MPVTFTLAILGLADATYLTYVHFTSIKNLKCSTGGFIDCASVTTSQQSEIFGHIPVALTGAIFYVFVVAMMSPWAWKRAELELPRIAFMVAGMGMVFYLLYAELVQIGNLCEYCTGVHAITFLLLVAVVLAKVRKPLPNLEDLAGAKA